MASARAAGVQKKWIKVQFENYFYREKSSIKLLIIFKMGGGEDKKTLTSQTDF